MKTFWFGSIAAMALSGAGTVAAQAAEAQRFQLDGLNVTVFAHAFLSEEELMTLRLVGQNRDALGVFVPEGGGFAALAVAPDEGFVRAGLPVDSATALSGLPDLETARQAVLESCDSLRSSSTPCEVVLEIAPQ